MQCQCKYDRLRPYGVRRLLGLVRCLIPGFLLVFVPKCPLCIVAYTAMFTGLGLSFTTAAYVRVGMIVVCAGAAAYLAQREYAKSRRAAKSTVHSPQ